MAPLPEAKATIVNSFEVFGFDDNATENAGYVSIPPDFYGLRNILYNRFVRGAAKGVGVWSDAFICPGLGRRAAGAGADRLLGGEGVAAGRSSS